jgi:hypothetical protein
LFIFFQIQSVETVIKSLFALEYQFPPLQGMIATTLSMIFRSLFEGHFQRYVFSVQVFYLHKLSGFFDKKK